MIRVIPPGLDRPRACRPMELASAVELLNHVFRGPPGNAQGPARPADQGWAYSVVYHPDNLQNLRVICRRGRVVSLVAIYDTEVRTPDGTGRVGGLCGVGTHPDYGRQGHAAAALRDAERHMRSTGRHLGLLGTTRHAFYRTLGWERAGQMRSFALDRRSAALLPSTQDPVFPRSCCVTAFRRRSATSAWPGRSTREARRPLRRQALKDCPRGVDGWQCHGVSSYPTAHARRV